MCKQIAQSLFPSGKMAFIFEFIFWTSLDAIQVHYAASTKLAFNLNKNLGNEKIPRAVK